MIDCVLRPSNVRRWSAKVCCGLLSLVVAVWSPAAVGVAGENAAGEFLYLENTDSGTISVVSIPNHELVGSIEVGLYPDDVTASHDGRVLYANRVESMGHPLSKRAGESGEIIAISTETEEILWRTPVGGWPHHITLTRDDRLLFVPLFNRMFIEVVDTEKQKVVDRIPAAMGSHGTKLSPDGRRLYVGSMMMDMLLVYDIATRLPVKRIPFRDAVRPFTMTSDEKTLYVQLSRLHGFQVVDLTAGEIVRQVDLPALPHDVELPVSYPHTYNHGLEKTPDERYLFAAGSAANYVCVYTLPDLEHVATIPVGREPNWIVFDEAGRFAYVSNRRSDELSVISVDKLQEIKRIPVDSYPQRMVTVNVPRRDR